MNGSNLLKSWPGLLILIALTACGVAPMEAGEQDGVVYLGDLEAFEKADKDKLFTIPAQGMKLFVLEMDPSIFQMRKYEVQEHAVTAINIALKTEQPPPDALLYLGPFPQDPAISDEPMIEYIERNSDDWLKRQESIRAWDAAQAAWKALDKQALCQRLFSDTYLDQLTLTLALLKLELMDLGLVPESARDSFVEDNLPTISSRSIHILPNQMNWLTASDTSYELPECTPCTDRDKCLPYVGPLDPIPTAERWETCKTCVIGYAAPCSPMAVFFIRNSNDFPVQGRLEIEREIEFWAKSR